MSYDIYGGILRNGHCDVHPHVHESYPCSVCLETDRHLQSQERDYWEAMKQQQVQDYKEQHQDWLLEILQGGDHVL